MLKVLGPVFYVFDVLPQRWVSAALTTLASPLSCHGALIVSRPTFRDASSTRSGDSRQKAAPLIPEPNNLPSSDSWARRHHIRITGRP